jgi:HAMP domain-containing protein
MPLYVSNDDDKYRRIESYVDKFSEIAFVRYYDEAGEPVFTDFAQGVDPGVVAMDKAALTALASSPENNQRYVIDALLRDVPLVRISKPIWTESVLADGLLGFDLDQEHRVSETLVGYIELGLDFTSHHEQLTRNMLTGAAIGGILLVLLTATSWFIYRRALRPLSQLQAPLRELASGKTNFHVSTSGHREIVAIADAMNTTLSALNERDKKLSQLANHDPLTGLINRHRFSEVLDQERAQVAQRGKPSALMFIDLDQFKYVNDMYGHAGPKHYRPTIRGTGRSTQASCPVIPTLSIATMTRRVLMARLIWCGAISRTSLCAFFCR